ncbi:MAG: hypothetical protein DWG80_05455 [Chloroflexi bacterium]|nr:hypothetical protein [Chloroflexota bacterium]
MWADLVVLVAPHLDQHLCLEQRVEAFTVEMLVPQPPTHEQLRSLIEWLDADADPNTDQAVYIHCHAGVGRTPSMAMALLMQHELSLAEAHRIVLAARLESSPTAAQLEWLREVEMLKRSGGTAQQ